MPILAPPPMELPPYVYEQARKNAASVVVIDVTTIQPLSGGTQGSCRLEGVVASVERGDRLSAGQAITVAIPCISPAWRPMPGPWPGFMDRDFIQTTQGRAYLDARGRLVQRGFDILAHSSSGD